jgi:hypothetical protein
MESAMKVTASAFTLMNACPSPVSIVLKHAGAKGGARLMTVFGE